MSRPNRSSLHARGLVAACVAFLAASLFGLAAQSAAAAAAAEPGASAAAAAKPSAAKRSTARLRACRKAARHTGRSRKRCSAAARAAATAPVLSVDGRILRWTRVGSARSFIVRSEAPGDKARFARVEGTSTTPTVKPGRNVTYRVRATGRYSNPASISFRGADGRLGAPVLRVEGRTLRWAEVAGVKSYVLATIVPGKPTAYRKLLGTSVTPPVVAGAVVAYGLRTDVDGSEWASEQSIDYRAPARGPAQSAPAAPESATAPDPVPAPVGGATDPAIKGDVSRIEPGLRGKPGVLWFGSFDTEDWTRTFRPSNFWRSHNTSVAPDGYEGRALKVDYPKNGWVGNDANPTGSQFRSTFSDLGLAAEAETMHLRYMVKFDRDFRWGTSGHNGGKLTGLKGGSVVAGSGSDGVTGFSARPVWENGGKLSFYAYHQGMSDGYGSYLNWDLGGQRYLEPGRWHSIEMAVKLNTPGRSDGWLKGWLDGDLAYQDTTFEWRGSSRLKIDHIAHETFFGGATSNYASPEDQSSYWDNMVLSSQPIGAPGR